LNQALKKNNGSGNTLITQPLQNIFAEAFRICVLSGINAGKRPSRR
jgi:hypothetical protein